MTNPLFSPHELGPHHLPNRIVMAPMTRCRSSQPGDIPNSLMARYYQQRASAGLIITEATQISPQGKGYSFTPGIHSAEQIAGWKQVTSAVHQAGGRIMVQLWHVGRMSHPVFHEDGQPVAPSAIAPDASVWVADPESGEGSMRPCPVPRALARHEIKEIVEQYRQAAANAMAAGFDGVELHGANGYLVDQFLRSTSNRRSDDYGGNQDRRLRFLTEVVEAVANEGGANRMGVRLSPYITERGMDDETAPETVLAAAERLDGFGVAYIHLVEADWEDEPSVPATFRRDLRDRYSGNIIVAGNYDAQRAGAIIEFGLADLVAFGRPFVANPDLPTRFLHGLPLSPYDPETLYGGGAAGYVDYPVSEPLQLAST